MAASGAIEARGSGDPLRLKMMTIIQRLVLFSRHRYIMYIQGRMGDVTWYGGGIDCGNGRARFLVLRIAASFPHNEATTNQIKEAIPSLIKLTTKDLEPSLIKPDECHWQEVIDNVILLGKGKTVYLLKGMQFVWKMGFV